MRRPQEAVPLPGYALDRQELDVTHRHGPVQQSVLALAAPATPAMHAPGGGVERTIGS